MVASTGGSKALGELFVKGKEKGKEEILSLSKEAQSQFAAHVFTDTYSEPTLVLLEAQNWQIMMYYPSLLMVRRWRK